MLDEQLNDRVALITGAALWDRCLYCPPLR